MERRELWAWLGGGLLALATVGLGVLGLMADAEPTAYWTTVALLALFALVGGVLVYLVQRHRFFGACVGRGIQLLGEWPMRADENGMPGWYLFLQVTRPGLSQLRIVTDEPIYWSESVHRHEAQETRGLHMTMGHTVVVVAFIVHPLEVGDYLDISIRSMHPPRVMSVRPQPKRKLIQTGFEEPAPWPTADGLPAGEEVADYPDKDGEDVRGGAADSRQ